MHCSCPLLYRTVRRVQYSHTCESAAFSRDVLESRQFEVTRRSAGTTRKNFPNGLGWQGNAMYHTTPRASACLSSYISIALAGLGLTGACSKLDEAVVSFVNTVDYTYILYFFYFLNRKKQLISTTAILSPTMLTHDTLKESEMVD